MKDHFVDFSFFLELPLFSFHFFFPLGKYIFERKKKKRVYEFIAAWAATEIKVLSLLNRCGMKSASSRLSLSKPCAERVHLLGKTLHSQAWRELELEEVTLDFVRVDLGAVYPDQTWKSGLLGFISDSKLILAPFLSTLLGALQGTMVLVKADHYWANDLAFVACGLDQELFLPPI